MWLFQSFEGLGLIVATKVQYTREKIKKLEEHSKRLDLKNHQRYIHQTEKKKNYKKKKTTTSMMMMMMRLPVCVRINKHIFMLSTLIFPLKFIHHFYYNDMYFNRVTFIVSSDVTSTLYRITLEDRQINTPSEINDPYCVSYV